MKFAANTALISSKGAGSPDQTPQKIHRTMERIYRNLHMVAVRMQNGATQAQGQSLVPGMWLRTIIEENGHISTPRCSEIASELGWMMLAILSFSEAFRDAAQTADDQAWVELLASVCVNFASIEMFAKSRGLIWESALSWLGFTCGILIPEQVKSSYNTVFTHPHEWHLTLTGEPARNRFRAPRLAKGDDVAIKPPDPPVRAKMPYLREYPNRGRGVRALQHIPAKQVLAEYVGRILPVNQREDQDYNLDYEPDGKCLASISSAILGNWTRYLNHSCDHNTEFELRKVGGKCVSCIVSIRPIEMFEEINVNYGGWYWSRRKLCRCGSGHCRYNTVAKVEEIELLHKAGLEERFSSLGFYSSVSGSAS
ncbi:MAG: hypothetical protein M1816_008058 [Peltula sp. TS41687]|nr:MAG: hypothetical protein M1816_008058 [Peltula sp. TS41687]